MLDGREDSLAGDQLSLLFSSLVSLRLWDVGPSNAAPEWQAESLGREAESCRWPVHSRGLFEVSLLYRQLPRAFASFEDPLQSWGDQRNGLPSMPAVDMKVAIGSKKQW